MNEARKLKHPQPGLMAVHEGESEMKPTDANKHKKFWFETTVLITWIVVFAIAFLFWILLLKLL